jgi:hypothetical protein
MGQADNQKENESGKSKYRSGVIGPSQFPVFQHVKPPGDTPAKWASENKMQLKSEKPRW